MKTGVYKITNIINNKIYVGSSWKCIIKRWRCHKSNLKKNKHTNKHLQRSWNKHGEENFKFEVLEYCEPLKCMEIEQYYIDTLNPEFNICKRVEGRIGCKLSKEQIERLRVINTGRPAWNKGKPFPKETRKRMSESRKLGLKNGTVKSWNKGRSFPSKGPVYCSNGKIYKSVRDAAKDLKVKPNTIVKACTDKKQIRKVKKFIVSYDNINNASKE